MSCSLCGVVEEGTIGRGGMRMSEGVFRACETRIDVHDWITCGSRIVSEPLKGAWRGEDGEVGSEVQSRLFRPNDNIESVYGSETTEAAEARGQVDVAVILEISVV